MTRLGQEDFIVLNGAKYQPMNYQVIDTEALAPRISSGNLGQQDRLNERITPYLSWHRGFGLGELRDTEDEGRYNYSKGIDARFRGQLTLGPEQASTTFGSNAESKVQFIEFNGNFYAIGARYVHILSGTTWNLSKDMGATAAAVKGCAVVYGGYLVVGAGGALDYWRLSTAGVWDQPAGGIVASLFALVGNTLWRVFNSNQLASSVNFTTFTTAVSIGDSVNVATMLTDYNGNPLVGKPEGLFEYDGTKVSNRLPEMAYRLDAQNCRGGKPTRGKLYLPVGPGLWTYTADAIQTESKPTRSAEVIAPGTSSRESSTEVRGPIKDLWPDIDFLWGVFAAQSGNYYIVAYDYNPTPGQGWHQVTMTGTTAVTALGRFGVATPVMYYSEGTTIKYFLLPKQTINPYADTTYRYALSGDIYLPVEADVFDDVYKSYLSIVINCDGLSTTKYVEVSFTIDGGVDTALGRITSSGVSTMYFPSSTTGRRILLHLRIVTDDATITPRILPFSRHFQLRFERKKRWKMTIVAAKQSIPNAPDYALKQLVALEAARDTISPVAYTDPDGRIWTVFVDKLGEQDYVNTGGPPSELVKGTPIELLEWRSGGGVSLWNSDTVVYDANFVWSNGSDNYHGVWS